MIVGGDRQDDFDGDGNDVRSALQWRNIRCGHWMIFLFDMTFTTVDRFFSLKIPRYPYVFRV